MPKLSLGPLTLAVNYLHKPRGRHTWHYRRLVPADLKQHYSSPQILKSLKTKDETQAMKRCLEMNHRTEAEFNRLRSGLPKEVPDQRFAGGMKLLARFGIGPESFVATDPHSQSKKDQLYEHFDELIKSKLSDEDYQRWYFDEEAEAYGLLPEDERAALELLKGKFVLPMAEYPEEYIRLKGRTGDKKFVDETHNAVKFLLQFLTNKPPSEYSRHELRTLIKAHLDAGMKTSSVHRRLSTLRAMINKVSLELELKHDQQHVFQKFDIPNFREDAVDRQDFTFDELSQLRMLGANESSEVIWLMHLMLDTGLRVNECCGLRQADVFVEDQSPYLILHANPFRRLKTKGSQRFVPLVGESLSAMMSALSAHQSEWVFPRYIDLKAKKTRNGSASAAVNKRIRSRLGRNAPTCHSFRHTMQTRLRQVECPKHISDELGGWSKSISDHYGSTADIENKTTYLKRSLEVRYRDRL